jgi:hypothetical protein
LELLRHLGDALDVGRRQFGEVPVMESGHCRVARRDRVEIVERG